MIPFALHPFLANISISYPLKTPENQKLKVISIFWVITKWHKYILNPAFVVALGLDTTPNHRASSANLFIKFLPVQLPFSNTFSGEE